MDKNKLIPLIAGIAILITGVSIYFATNKPKKAFSAFYITYNAQVNEYTNVAIDNSYVIDNLTLWVKSINGDYIIVNSSENLKENGKSKNEFKISMDKDTVICFKEDNCITMRLG